MHTSSLSSPPLVAGAVPGTCSVEAPACATSSESGSLDVSAVRQAEDRLDALIADMDARSVAAMKAGDPAAARRYVDQMYAAIHSRSPEHQARKTAELEQRIAEQADYFGYRGQLDREVLEKRTA